MATQTSTYHCTTCGNIAATTNGNQPHGIVVCQKCGKKAKLVK